PGGELLRIESGGVDLDVQVGQLLGGIVEARGADVVGVVEAPGLERAGRLGAPVHLVGLLAGTTATSAARREQQCCWQSDEDQALLGRHLTGPSQFEYRRRRRRADDRSLIAVWNPSHKRR